MLLTKQVANYGSETVITSYKGRGTMLRRKAVGFRTPRQRIKRKVVMAKALAALGLKRNVRTLWRAAF